MPKTAQAVIQKTVRMERDSLSSANPNTRVNPAALTLRNSPAATDQSDVATILSATDMFTAAEIDIAVSLLAEPIDAGYRFLFADHSEGLAGFACYGHIPGTDRSYDLYWIAVQPACQGAGLGRRLLSAVERAVIQNGGERLYVDTSGRQQYAATRKFYLAAGYAVAAELPDFYRPGDGKIIFCKALGPAQDMPV